MTAFFYILYDPLSTHPITDWCTAAADENFIKLTIHKEYLFS
jgi:hypothetical protein